MPQEAARSHAYDLAPASIPLALRRGVQSRRDARFHVRGLSALLPPAPAARRVERQRGVRSRSTTYISYLANPSFDLSFNLVYKAVGGPRQRGQALQEPA